MDNKFFSFKRFVTFGLGLGMFMSAASGFAQTTLIGSTLSVQGNTLNANNAPLTLRGEKADGTTTKLITLDGNGFLSSTGGATFSESVNTNQNLSAGGNITNNGTLTSGGNITSTNGTVKGKEVVSTGKLTSNGVADLKGGVSINGDTNTTGNVNILQGKKLTATGNVELGQAGTVTTVNGSRIDINTTTTNINSALATNINSLNTNTKTLNAAGNVTSTGIVTGKQGLQAGNNNEFTVSNTGNVQAKGVTADNFATTGGKVNINGNNGNIVTQGVFNANGKAFVDGTDGSITATGVTKANGGLKVFNGATITGGLDVQNSKITRVATGTETLDAVNVGQMKNTIKEATAVVQANVDTEVTDRKAEITRVDGRIDTETRARIDGDASTLSQANTYTDNHIQAQSGADRAYTNQQVGAERERAMAAEAAISKEVKQVGAMAMAAAAVAGATPTGDKKTAISAAVGGYSGQTAVAVGVTHMVTPMFKAFGSLSKVSGGKTGVAVGGSFSF